MKRLHQGDYTVTQWSGGKTTQIAIAPEGAIYSNRDFLWRVSSATVDLDESDFTALPDYHRWISTLQGDMVLSHNGKEKITLYPYDVHEFEGSDQTHSWGKCKDFNLMLQKEKAVGKIWPVFLPCGEQYEINVQAKPHSTILLFCAEGTATIADYRCTINIEKGEAVLAEEKCGDGCVICSNTTHESITIMVAEITEIK